MNRITRDRLLEVLEYRIDTGQFVWREGRGSRAPAGGVAGSLDRDGYRQIVIDRRIYCAHWLAWLYMHGVWPSHQIDHCNGVRDDNRGANLREATISENQQNVAKREGASSRFLGVTWHKNARKWNAKIQHHGRKHHLGYFDTEESAHAAYLEAKTELHRFNPAPREGAHGSAA